VPAEKNISNEVVVHNIDYFSRLREAIIRKDDLYFVESGDVIGEQQQLPIKEALLYLKNSEQLSTSQYSELITLYNLAYDNDGEPGKKMDVSTIRLNTFQDMKNVIENSHKKTFLVGSGNTYVETPELLYWAKIEKKISKKEAKQLLRIYVKKLFDHQGRNYKKEIISGLSFACSQNILESIDELVFILETVRNEKIRLEILEKVNTSSIGKFTHPAEDWVSVSSHSEQGELETNLQEIEATAQDVFEGHRVFSEQRKSLIEDIALLRDREGKQGEEILSLRLGVDEKDKRIQNLEKQKGEIETIYLESLSKIGAAFDAEKKKTQGLKETIKVMESVQEESRKASREVVGELNEKILKLLEGKTQQEKHIKKLEAGIKNMSLAEKERKTNDEKIIKILEAVNKEHLGSIESLLKKTEALEKEVETLKSTKIALEVYIQKSLKKADTERAQQEEKILNLETEREIQRENMKKLESEKTTKESSLKTKNRELEKGIKALQIEIAKTKIQTNRIKLMLNRSKEAMLQPSIQ
jgi:hypothetical protein